MAIKNPFRMVGGDAVKARMKVAAKSMAAAEKRGRIKGGFHLQRQAQKMVPIDKGFLRASAVTVWPNKGGSSPKKLKGKMASDHQREVAESKARTQLEKTIEVLFTSYYAVYVHEDMEANHTVGEAKYLEKPLNNERQEIMRLIADEIRKGNR